MKEFPKNPNERDGPEYIYCCGSGCDLMKLGAEFRHLEQQRDEETARADKLKKACLHWVCLVELQVHGCHVDWQDELNHYLNDKQQRTEDDDYES